MINQPLGAHLSIAGGFSKAIQDAESIGCTALQIFLHSNRQWAMKDLTDKHIEDFHAASDHSKIKYIMVHASYLINLGSGQVATRHRSLGMLKNELIQCEQLGIPYLVLHPGTATGVSKEESIHLIGEGISDALESISSKTVLLLENTAGQGNAIGSRLEELKTLLKDVRQKKRIGICFDTCHGFAAGYDFTTPATYKAFWQLFDDVIGLEHLKAFHFNDSKKGLDSHVDRHEQIGKGKLGIEPFRLLMNDTRFERLPKILETPYTDYKKDALRLYQENLELLRSLIK